MTSGHSQRGTRAHQTVSVCLGAPGPPLETVCPAWATLWDSAPSRLRWEREHQGEERKQVSVPGWTLLPSQFAVHKRLFCVSVDRFVRQSYCDPVLFLPPSLCVSLCD